MRRGLGGCAWSFEGGGGGWSLMEWKSRSSFLSFARLYCNIVLLE